MIKRFLQSHLTSLGAISVLTVAPILFQGAPAQAQVIDGRLTEYRVGAVPTLAYGATGAAVQDLQIFLDELGYYNGTSDGVYNNGLLSAVQDFQSDYGLVSDGIVGYNTWNTLLNIDSESVFEEEDSFDSATGLYSDYEEGISEDEGFLGEGGISDDEGEGVFNDESVF